MSDLTEMDGIKIDVRLDLRGVLCPLNFVKTKLELEEMQPGEVLEVILDEGEPIKSVPRSVKEEGHQIIKIEKLSNTYKLLIQKAFCLPKQHADQIITYARSQAPLECCGVIAGINGKVTKVYTATNIEQSPVRYNIDPQEILGIYKEIEEKGWQLLGIYHSHTHSEAYPSPADIKLAFWTDSLYLIISLQNAEQPVIRAFHIRDGTIKEIPLKIV